MRRLGIGMVILAASAAGCAGPDAEPAVGVTVHRVVIQAFGFQPAELDASPGDTIVWINRDVVPHTATSHGAGWDTGEIPAGKESRIVVESVAEGDYICTFHPTMRGILRVR